MSADILDFCRPVKRQGCQALAVASQRPLREQEEQCKMTDLITDDELQRMTKNYKTNAARAAEGKMPIDFQPVVKIFIPAGGPVWLLTEYDPDYGLFYGLCDLGYNIPELGNVFIEDLESAEGPLGTKARRDTEFQAAKTLGQYTREARRAGGIAV